MVPQGLPGRHRHRQPVHGHALRGARPRFPQPRGTTGYASDGQRGAIGALETSDALKSHIKDKDWNQFHVIARGGTLIHILNGHVTALFVDDVTKNRTLKGLLGFQIHVGPPMKVEFRNIYLKAVKKPSSQLSASRWEERREPAGREPPIFNLQSLYPQ